MYLKKVSVKSLFGCYSYEIKMLENRRITIIHAPNGYGKTTVLKIINAVMNHQEEVLYDIPFKEIKMEFGNNGAYILIAKSDNKDLPSNIDKRCYERAAIRHSARYTLTIIVQMPAGKPRVFDLFVIENMMKSIIGPDSLRRLEEYLRRLGFSPDVIEETLMNHRLVDRGIDDIKRKYCQGGIYFISSNRLFAMESRRNERLSLDYISDDDLEDFAYFSARHKIGSRKNLTETKEAIIEDCEQLLEIITEARMRYSEIQEKKDRDFPDRLVSSVNDKDAKYDSIDSISRKIIELEEKRKELQQMGLVLIGKSSMLPGNTNLDKSMLKFYTLYIEDTKEKLGVFDDLKHKLELFLEIINQKMAFGNKVMKVDTKKGIIFESTITHKPIPLEKLSSGEKNDFILFYQLIFAAKPKSIVLIDEPEISLHVAWQNEFIDELMKICKLNSLQAIVATHSPDIVNGNDDLLVSLGLEE